MEWNAWVKCVTSAPCLFKRHVLWPLQGECCHSLAKIHSSLTILCDFWGPVTFLCNFSLLSLFPQHSHCPFWVVNCFSVNCFSLGLSLRFSLKESCWKVSVEGHSWCLMLFWACMDSCRRVFPQGGFYSSFYSRLNSPKKNNTAHIDDLHVNLIIFLSKLLSLLYSD